MSASSIGGSEIVRAYATPAKRSVRATALFAVAHYRAEYGPVARLVCHADDMAAIGDIGETVEAGTYTPRGVVWIVRRTL